MLSCTAIGAGTSHLIGLGAGDFAAGADRDGKEEAGGTS
jgi:hypothetical protein